MAVRRNSLQLRLPDDLELTWRAGRTIDAKPGMPGRASAPLRAPGSDRPIPGGHPVTRLAGSDIALQDLAVGTASETRGRDFAKGKTARGSRQRQGDDEGERKAGEEARANPPSEFRAHFRSPGLKNPKCGRDLR